MSNSHPKLIKRCSAEDPQGGAAHRPASHRPLHEVLLLSRLPWVNMSGFSDVLTNPRFSLPQLCSCFSPTQVQFTGRVQSTAFSLCSRLFEMPLAVLPLTSTIKTFPLTISRSGHVISLDDHCCQTFHWTASQWTFIIEANCILGLYLLNKQCLSYMNLFLPAS